MRYEVTIPEDIATHARGAVQRMVDLGLKGQNFEGGTMKDVVVEDGLSLSSMETLSQ